MVSNKISFQNQLQNPCVRNPDESNESFDHAIRENVYCSITVANHRLITALDSSRKVTPIPKKNLQIVFIYYFMHTRFSFRKMCVLVL